MGTCGIASGSRAVLSAAMEELTASGRTDVRLTTSGCIGACEHEPEMTVEVIDHEPVLYGDLDAETTRKVFQEHVIERPRRPRARREPRRPGVSARAKWS